MTMLKPRLTPRLAAVLAVLLTVLLFTACAGPESHDATPAEPAPASEAPVTETPADETAATTGELCPDPPACGDGCSNTPYEPITCWPTTHGPAEADIVVGNPLTSPNMLYCDGGTYALCFFSGPPDSTGKNPSTNPPLPCSLEGDIANCTCQAYTSGPYFVDINSILNFGAYNATLALCNADGSGCANLSNCGSDGSKAGCGDLPQAPVCQWVAGQNSDDPSTSLIPGADLISAFSFAMDTNYELGSVPCEGLYAGCMTAPCFAPEGATEPLADGDPVQCQCPTYSGTFQVGQKGQTCAVPEGYAWSASNAVSE